MVKESNTLETRRNEFKVGDKVNWNMYSDVLPCTVVDIKRKGREITVQIDKYKLEKGEKPNILPGGFSGHCVNQRALKYNITRNENGRKITFTVRKVAENFYVWNIKGGNLIGRNQIKNGWSAFYDYNF